MCHDPTLEDPLKQLEKDLKGRIFLQITVFRTKN